MRLLFLFVTSLFNPLDAELYSAAYCSSSIIIVYCDVVKRTITEFVHSMFCMHHMVVMYDLMLSKGPTVHSFAQNLIGDRYEYKTKATEEGFAEGDWVPVDKKGGDSGTPQVNVDSGPKDGSTNGSKAEDSDSAAPAAA